MAHLVGTPGADTITGTADRDLIEGGAGDDALLGGGGYDVIHDGPGSDRCHLGSGGGTIVADLTDAVARDWYFGDPTAADRTSVSYQYAVQSVVVNLKTGVARGAEIGWDRLVDISGVIGGAGNDRLFGNDLPINGFQGGAGHDTIHGYGGFDRLQGDGGDDRLYGGDGDDWLDGYDGNDIIRGGAGDDIVDRFSSTSLGADRIFGDGGRDWLFGGTGNDRISGGDGDDVIVGGEGQNILIGGAGADVFDTFQMNPGEATAGDCDVIVDFEDGVDKLDVPAWEVNFWLDGARTISTGIAITLGFGAILQIRDLTLAQFDATDFI